MLQYFPKMAATYRRPSGVYVDSRWVPAAVAEIPIMIIRPQPANGRELQMLPEGDRQYSHLKTWTAAEVMPNDVLTFRAVEYRVVSSKDYQFDGAFHKILLRACET